MKTKARFDLLERGQQPKCSTYYYFIFRFGAIPKSPSAGRCRLVRGNPRLEQGSHQQHSQPPLRQPRVRIRVAGTLGHVLPHGPFWAVVQSLP
jgi:hypothetical protein